MDMPNVYYIQRAIRNRCFPPLYIYTYIERHEEMRHRKQHVHATVAVILNSFHFCLYSSLSRLFLFTSHRSFHDQTCLSIKFTINWRVLKLNTPSISHMYTPTSTPAKQQSCRGKCVSTEKSADLAQRPDNI